MSYRADNIKKGNKVKCSVRLKVMRFDKAICEAAHKSSDTDSDKTS